MGVVLGHERVQSCGKVPGMHHQFTVQGLHNFYLAIFMMQRKCLVADLSSLIVLATTAETRGSQRTYAKVSSLRRQSFTVCR